MTVFWRWLRRGLYVLFAVLLVLATAVTIILTTQPGTRLALMTANYFAPGELKYSQVEGSLLRDLKFENLSYQQDDLIDLEIGALHFRWRPWQLLRKQLHIRELSIDSMVLNLNETEDVSPSPEQSLFPVELPDIRLPIDVRIDRLLVTNTTFNQENFTQSVNRAQLRARSRGEALHLYAFSITTPEVHAQLNGQLTPIGDYPLNLNTLVRVELPEIGMTTVSGNISGNTHSLALTQSIQGNINANLNISVSDPLTENLSWSGDIQAEQTSAFPLHQDIEQGRLRLQGSGSMRSVSGELNVELVHNQLGPISLQSNIRFEDESLQLSSLQFAMEDRSIAGSLTGNALIRSDQLDVDMNGAIQAADIPDTDLSFRYRGSMEAAEELRLTATLGESRFVVDGNARWVPDLQWELALSSDNFDFSPYLSNYPGTLTAQMNTSGQWSEDPEITMDIQQLSVVFSGALLAGRIDSQGSLGGSLSKPRGRLSAQLSDFRYQGHSLESAELDLQADLLAEKLPTGSLTLEHIELTNGTLVEHLSLEMTEEGKLHQTELQVQGEDFAFNTRLVGEWQDYQWRGEAPTLQGYYQNIRGWELQRPVKLVLSASEIIVDNLCMARQEHPSELCSDVNWNADSETLNAIIEAQEISLGLMRPWLPNELDVAGSLSLNANFSMQSGEMNYEGKAHLSDSIISLPDQDLELILNEGEILDFSGDENEAQANISITTSNLEGGITSRLQLSQMQQGPQIDGDLQLSLTQLAVISVIAPELQSVRGQINGSLAFSGAIATPTISGSVTIENGRAEVPFVGITLTDLTATLRAPDAAGEPFTLSGSTTSGEGELSFDGRYQLDDHSAALNVRGENFTAMQTRELELYISPNIELNYTPELIHIRGSLHVPRARITPPDIEMVDNQSRDTRILHDEETLYEDSSMNIPVDMELQVSLGDNVHVSAFGFEGRLAGRLRIIETPGQQTSAVGNINVAAGRYEIYGQSLDIERGNLIFTGGLIDNPGLDLRVSRSISTDNVTVGARVGGFLREPNLSLFSTPTMQDSMILSYLIFGRAPGPGNAQEQNMLAQASLALGMRGGNFIGEQISDRLGVDEVMIDATGENLQSTSLFIGKHLSSRLYVKYGIGLVEPVTTFFIRYRLTEHINFETRTGDGQSGADLFYTIER